MMYTIWYSVDVTPKRHWGDKPRAKREALEQTHAPVAFVDGGNLEDVYAIMQGEKWSPNGEARDIISTSNTWHTSMSVGDVIVNEAGDAWEVADFGFHALN